MLIIKNRQDKKQNKYLNGIYTIQAITTTTIGSAVTQIQHVWQGN